MSYRRRSHNDDSYGGGIPIALLKAELRLLRNLFRLLFRRHHGSGKWELLLARRRAHPEADLVQVRKVYQLARTGTKAVIRFEGSGKSSDAWFHSHRVKTGDYLLITGSDGFGRHHRTICRYVRPEQIYASAPRRARRRYNRQVSGQRADRASSTSAS
ncbi:hypothetical protein GCM10022222_78140 [Amycolatopsis ultiminotia]|uniref:Uncharacterized protein n=1 Tax=Amycolatopsis ultiminotia TaxID=543629 RepID=A0ABP6YIK3_9PSEU